MHLTTTYRYVRKVTFSFFGYGYTYVHRRSGNFSEMLLTVFILCHHWNTAYRNWNGTSIWHFFMWPLFSCQIFAVSISVPVHCCFGTTYYLDESQIFIQYHYICYDLYLNASTTGSLYCSTRHRPPTYFYVLTLISLDGVRYVLVWACWGVALLYC